MNTISLTRFPSNKAELYATDAAEWRPGNNSKTVLSARSQSLLLSQSFCRKWLSLPPCYRYSNARARIVFPERLFIQWAGATSLVLRQGSVSTFVTLSTQWRCIRPADNKCNHIARVLLSPRHARVHINVNGVACPWQISWKLFYLRLNIQCLDDNQRRFKKCSHYLSLSNKREKMDYKL